jgi:hypothetical protein
MGHHSLLFVLDKAAKPDCLPILLFLLYRGPNLRTINNMGRVGHVSNLYVAQLIKIPFLYYK